ncbi:SpoIIIAH-like family protein [Sporosarcina beigongshangi]|uniref:SpoIIIAH-like family protein n=1 Tax=Sporosarcina beigongshangi TaxID=2782538 RepID=UPI001939BFBE|nr:SpoIIIAH-like family protein [Sporosarcina beigongshangi]
MRTNKRTVWFLTLLSLVAVISIYTMREKTMSFDGITLFTKGESKDSLSLSEQLDAADKTAPVFAERYLFEEMRMEVRDVRSKLAEQLTTKITSSDYTAAEKNDAIDEMAEMTKRNSDETLMEMQIIALGYPEAFVHKEEGAVKITVMATEGQSKTLADEIIRHVKTSWSDAGTVQVVFTGGTEE